MNNNDINIDFLQNLAMIGLDKQEKMKILTEIQNMIKLVEELKHIDTSGIPDDLSFELTNNVFRTDKTENIDFHKNLITNCPESKEGYITVPQILD